MDCTTGEGRCWLLIAECSARRPEKTWIRDQRKRGLQREVLEHLTRYGPKKCDTLSIHFALDRRVNIQPVLDVLKDASYIEVSEDKDQIVRITPSGLKPLEKQDY